MMFILIQSWDLFWWRRSPLSSILVWIVGNHMNQVRITRSYYSSSQYYSLWICFFNKKKTIIWMLKGFNWEQTPPPKQKVQISRHLDTPEPWKYHVKYRCCGSESESCVHTEHGPVHRSNPTWRRSESYTSIHLSHYTSMEADVLPSGLRHPVLQLLQEAASMSATKLPPREEDRRAFWASPPTADTFTWGGLANSQSSSPHSWGWPQVTLTTLWKERPRPHLSIRNAGAESFLTAMKRTSSLWPCAF